MIIHVQITEQPLAGKYPEQIFDAPISVEDWTWVKFEDENYNEFYGQFRGAPYSVAVSSKYATCYVLTGNYLYEIDCNNPTDYIAHDFWDLGHTLRNFTVTPNGDPIFSDDYTIFTIEGTLSQQQEINPPIDLDMIQFKHWDNQLLHISAEEFIIGKPVALILDANTMKIRFK
ncbi:hypothetical protein [Psychrobacillus vulpis]|uniref:Uncharacterized protein n=1 Tax=Psychrobacillus vulpis TaxID=2325572 RepID=A0A544TRH8_9BACI|nr:hypothetical protein [Psychrobacillus vulpis]TQR20049.1 hypothetical protein FG384_09130 [Psychrobacillus vulpis]